MRKVSGSTCLLYVNTLRIHNLFVLGFTGKRKKSKKSKKRVKKEEEKKYEVSFSRIMKLNAPEWPYIALGCVAAALHGATFPAWAIFFGDFFAVSTFSVFR